jgi:hypothetical protein
VRETNSPPGLNRTPDQLRLSIDRLRFARSKTGVQRSHRIARSWLRRQLDLSLFHAHFIPPRSRTTHPRFAACISSRRRYAPMRSSSASSTKSARGKGVERLRAARSRACLPLLRSWVYATAAGACGVALCHLAVQPWAQPRMAWAADPRMCASSLRVSSASRLEAAGATVNAPYEPLEPGLSAVSSKSVTMTARSDRIGAGNTWTSIGRL